MLQPLRPAETDTPSARELRTAITTTRRRLVDVLHARARTLGSTLTWYGPHRDRWEQDTADLLAAGRVLDQTLAGLLTALDAEIEAGRR